MCFYHSSSSYMKVKIWEIATQSTIQIPWLSSSHLMSSMSLLGLISSTLSGLIARYNSNILNKLFRSLGFSGSYPSSIDQNFKSSLCATVSLKVSIALSFTSRREWCSYSSKFPSLLFSTCLNFYRSWFCGLFEMAWNIYSVWLVPENASIKDARRFPTWWG